MAKTQKQLSEETVLESIPDVKTPEERIQEAAQNPPMPTPEPSKFVKAKVEPEKKINRAGETKKPELVYVIGSDDDPENRREMPVNAIFRDTDGKQWPALICSKYLSKHEVPDATRKSEWRAVREPWYVAKVNFFRKITAGRIANNWVTVRGVKLESEVGDHGKLSKNRWLTPMEGAKLPDYCQADERDLALHQINEIAATAGGIIVDGVPEHNDLLIEAYKAAGLIGGGPKK